ncbi:hypothetical protein B296_00034738, partial [Ensete ventricosum]
DTVGFRRESARRFAEGIGKLAENTPGDHRRKTIGLTARIPEAVRLCGRFDLPREKIGSGHRCASRRRTRE